MKDNRLGAIIGYGEVPSGYYAERSALDTAISVSLQAIKSAGINKDEIDTIMVAGTLYDLYEYNVSQAVGWLVDELGLNGKVKRSYELFSGGSSSSNQIEAALALIQTGRAKNVLLVHDEKLGTGVPPEKIVDIFRNGGFSGEWEIPVGFQDIPLLDFETERYLYETGATVDDVASVYISNRAWAAKTPNGLYYKQPITMEELKATMQVSNCQYMGMYPQFCDGGSAVIITSVENAQKHDKPVYILGEGGVSYRFASSYNPEKTRIGYAEAAKEAFDMAGLTPKDMDFAEIYDAFPIHQLVAFEALGFVEKGEGAKFFAEGKAAPGGEFPVTTNGGMAGMGHSGAGGSYSLLVEAVRQLRGEAGDRQVPNAKYGLYTATGGSYSDMHVTILGN